ncbi:hypothetical protein M427DRAFT_132061 [Gonapodya prolifera JEL478]|uniref:Uncharacterized protein n=1 Tax=Gonapodya prolifera (strain JEL478) TaxID=1344416 RepID=A0A139AS95_GONPJ|nr:hypothetical protein M427DRAFT_132061 [Gonapodya prolifera JEL478]|eukprot:KXS19569.1 hypothetical protein M427DRAFT_132061 [Gonapodya prolifera JEL478]
MRPLENRVAYRISKLAAKQDTPGATEGTDDVRAGADIARDPLRFAPRPAALAGEDDSSSSDEDDGASASAGEATVKPKSKSKSKLSSSKKQKSSASDDADEVITASKASTLPYRPPRFAPTVLASTTAKPSRRGTDGTGRGASLAASRSRILRDLQAQFGDAPEDLSADGTGWGPRGEAEMTEAERFIKEKEKFEEEHFVRLPTSRKERKARMELAKMAGVWRGRDELESLDDFSTLSKLDSRVRRLNAMEHGTGALGRSRKRTLAASSEPSSKRARTMAGEEIVAEAARTGASVRRELTREKKKVKKLVKRKEKREKRREAKGAAA